MPVDASIPLSGIAPKLPTAGDVLSLASMMEQMRERKEAADQRKAGLASEKVKEILGTGAKAYYTTEGDEETKNRAKQKAIIDQVGELRNSGLYRSLGFNEQKLDEMVQHSNIEIAKIHDLLGPPKRGAIPAGLQEDPASGNYSKVPVMGAVASPGPEWKEDPKSPGSFIHTGLMTDSGDPVSLKEVAKGPAPAKGYKVPNGWMPDPDRPGSIKPMPGGPADPSGDTKPSETALGKIADDERHGRITKAQADKLRHKLEHEDEWGPPLAVTDKDGNPMLVQQKKGTTELRTVRAAKQGQAAGKADVSITPKGDKTKAGLTVADKMNPVMLATVRTDIAEVKNFLSQVDKFSEENASMFFEDEKAGPMARYFKKGLTPDKQQQYDTIANRLAVAIASAQSMGRGQLSDAKVAEARKLVPVPGDTKGNKEMKLKQIRRLTEIFEEQLKSPIKGEARGNVDDLKDVLDFWEK